MNLSIFQVDAFTDRVFGGNPAAVCPLSHWLPNRTMQQIAAENNLAETAFYVATGDDFDLKWFTPTIEIDLCGHATLASAYVLFNIFNYAGEEIRFHSNSGLLKVKKDQDWLTMDFPADEITETSAPQHLTEALQVKPLKIFRGKTDYLVIVSDEEEVRNVKPDLLLLQKISGRGVIISSRGKESDFVSRFFAPNVGINEDPVTGSAHTTLTPYWAKELNKPKLSAIQLSERKGFLNCTLNGSRIEISGQARLYLKGEICLDHGE